ncbi:hypothetical protein F5890DRAFT_1560409 [Lentinula detonsa]|uniref:Uncharacterized protein n=1 Tax=Lentinula detonsa TaxID=2804962 RepID=A0AA38PNB3_9AGAR|nr:hypothetical protein F5890DRAFT_1560409 [Lentinula detonsa]
MSTSSNDETIQQRRERILQAQAARQRAREEEIARHEAEFTVEMERIEAEEKAAREAEEKRQAEERRIEEEKRWEEERKAEEERVIRQKKKEQEIAEKKRLEERRIVEEKRRVEEAAAAAEDELVRNAAYAKLVEENRVEREKAAKELEKRQKRPVAKAQPVTVVITPRPSGSKKKSFKSKSIISDDSDVEQREAMPAPRGEKRKRPIKMIAGGGPHSDLDEDFEPENPTNSPLLSTDPSQNRPACARWSGDNASRRSRGKRVKLDDDEVYEGPAARAGERRFEGPGIAEQLAAIVERIMYLLVRREKRELKVLGGKEERSEDEDEDEDEDGEGEEDKEEKEKNDEEKRREEIREGKKRAN